MWQQLRTAIAMMVSLTIITGVLYPLTITVIAQIIFPYQARGSLLQYQDRTVGAVLIGQSFSKPEYLWGRLSATGPVSYNAAASSGSNYGPLHPDLKKTIEARIAAVHAAGIHSAKIPVDLVTSSGSGLDPHISPAAAEFQVARIAMARKMSEGDVRKLVQQNTEDRQFGMLGEPRVNVLRVNIALDALRETNAK